MTSYKLILLFFLGEDIVGFKGEQGEQGRDDVDGPPGLRGEPGTVNLA